MRPTRSPQFGYRNIESSLIAPVQTQVSLNGDGRGKCGTYRKRTSEFNEPTRTRGVAASPLNGLGNLTCWHVPPFRGASPPGESDGPTRAKVPRCFLRRGQIVRTDACQSPAELFAGVKVAQVTMSIATGNPGAGLPAKVKPSIAHPERRRITAKIACIAGYFCGDSTPHRVDYARLDFSREPRWCPWREREP